MRTIQFTLPATISDPGPAINSLALAIGLHNVVTVSEAAAGIEFDFAGQLPDSIRECIQRDFMAAARSIFQSDGRAPAGLRIRFDVNIPPQAGLGNRTTIILAALLAANEIVSGARSKTAIIEQAARLTGTFCSAAACLHGGLVAATPGGAGHVYSEISVTPMQVVVVSPGPPSPATSPRVSGQVNLADAAYDIGHALLLVQALSHGNFDLLAAALDDRLDPARFAPGRQTFERARAVARAAGAAGLTTTGRGSTLVAFASENHAVIAGELVSALTSDTGLDYVSWILPVDFHGVTVSEVGAGVVEQPQPASSLPVAVNDFASADLEPPGVPSARIAPARESGLSEGSEAS